MSQWSYSTASISPQLRENISGSEILPNTYTYYNAYEPKFVFRKEGASEHVVDQRSHLVRFHHRKHRR